MFIFVYLCSSLYFSWYQSSNLRALFVTFIIAEIVDPSKDFSSPYHVSFEQHMICSLSTQQERQFFIISQRQISILGEEVMKDDILPKSAVIVGGQGM